MTRPFGNTFGNKHNGDYMNSYHCARHRRTLIINYLLHMCNQETVCQLLNLALSIIVLKVVGKHDFQTRL